MSLEDFTTRRGERAMSREIDWVRELALVIAKERFGPGVTMSGAHNPTPGEMEAARRFLDLYGSNQQDISGIVDATRKITLSDVRREVQALPKERGVVSGVKYVPLDDGDDSVMGVIRKLEQ